MDPIQFPSFGVKGFVDCAKHGPDQPATFPRHLIGQPQFCDKCAEQARLDAKAQNDADHEAELKAARSRWLEGLLGRAAVPDRFKDARLDDVQHDPDHADMLRRMREYVRRWPLVRERGSSVVLFGATGTGKSHALAAVVREVIAQGASAAFMRHDSLINLIRSTYGQNATRSELEVVQPLQRLDLLGLDEVGTGSMSPFETRAMHNLLAERHENRRPSIVTSNLLRPDIELILGGERMEDRMQSWTWIDCQWASWRRTEAYRTEGRSAA